MMKPRSSRVISSGEVMAASGRKTEGVTANGPAVQRNQAQMLNNQQTSAQAIRKRRSSINVYDQPSSLNSRLRQLETDMLRLDEDRTKLFDDTHSSLAQYELKLNEIHAILKSRQDNVEKYVDDMKLLLQAKEEFERQAKLLNEKNDRIHEKFMHRETTISREIKLLKNKFELLEKNRQFRSILQKSNTTSALTSASDNKVDDDLISGLESSEFQAANKIRSEATSEADSLQFDGRSRGGSSSQMQSNQRRSSRNVRIKLTKLNSLSQFFAPLFNGVIGRKRYNRRGRRKSNRISSIGQQQQSSQAQKLQQEHQSTSPNEFDLAETSASGSGSGSGSGGATIEVKEQKNKKSRGSIFGRLFR